MRCTWVKCDCKGMLGTRKLWSWLLRCYSCGRSLPVLNLCSAHPCWAGGLGAAPRHQHGGAGLCDSHGPLAPCRLRSGGHPWRQAPDVSACRHARQPASTPAATAAAAAAAAAAARGGWRSTAGWQPGRSAARRFGCAGRRLAARRLCSFPGHEPSGTPCRRWAGSTSATAATTGTTTGGERRPAGAFPPGKHRPVGCGGGAAGRGRTSWFGQLWQR
jgi:hypothetical protein